jgi:ketol-acid reductoisomerase
MDERSGLVAEGLQYLDKAMSINPEYEDILWYENLLSREQSAILKEKARQTQDANEMRTLLATAAELDARADDWSNRALEVRKKNAEKARALGTTGNGQ